MSYLRLYFLGGDELGVLGEVWASLLGARADRGLNYRYSLCGTISDAELEYVLVLCHFVIFGRQ